MFIPSFSRARAYFSFKYVTTTNGKFLGSFPLDYGEGDKIEGLCLDHFSNSSGTTSFVHAIVLDNEATEDDVYINHFSVPDSTVV